MSNFTLIKKNPTQGEITSSLTGSTGDGAGLNLQSGGNIEIANGAAQFGTSDFSIEFILNQEKENASEGYIYVTHVSGANRLLIFHDVSDDNLVLDFRDSSGTSKPENTKDLPYDMNQDFGSPTHYVITFDRSGLATLYKNGNSVASVDISSTSAIDIGTDSSGSRIGTSGTDGVIGTFYRFRTWNKLVDAKALFERADVDFADQYGTANAPFTSINLSSGWTVTSSPLGVIDDANTYTTPGSGSGVLYPLTVGKNYRLTWNVTGSAFDGPRMVTVGEGYIAIPDAPSSGTLSGTLEFTATKEKLYLRNGSAGTVDINSMSLVQIGAVVDMDLAFANPSQSRTVQNRAGLPDGEASASGVTQVQKLVQGNLTSLAVTTTSQAAGVPADGAIVADKVGVGGATSANASADGDDLVCGSTSGAATGASIVSTTTGNGSIFFTDGAGYKNQGQIKYDHATDAMTVATNTAVALTIASTGLATFSGGINLGDETLSNYDEGSWTVRFYDAASGGNTDTDSAATAYYTRVGRLVTISLVIFDIQIDGMTGGNQMYFSLPFAVGTPVCIGSVTTRDVEWSSGTTINCLFGSGSGTQRGSFIAAQDNGAWHYPTVADFSGTGDVYVTGQYMI